MTCDSSGKHYESSSLHDIDANTSEYITWWLTTYKPLKWRPQIIHCINITFAHFVWMAIRTNSTNFRMLGLIVWKRSNSGHSKSRNMKMRNGKWEMRKWEEAHNILVQQLLSFCYCMQNQMWWESQCPSCTHWARSVLHFSSLLVFLKFVQLFIYCTTLYKNLSLFAQHVHSTDLSHNM